MMFQGTWKTLLLIVVVLLLSDRGLISRGHVGDDPIVLAPKWKKGDKLSFEMVKTHEQTQGGKVTMKATVRTPFEIEVMAVNKDGFVVAWTFGATEFDDPNIAKNPIVKKMSNLLKGHRIVLEMNSKGAIQGVENWKELKEAALKPGPAATKALLP